jgi:predicted O-methyltransferase YrrM
LVSTWEAKAKNSKAGECLSLSENSQDASGRREGGVLGNPSFQQKPRLERLSVAGILQERGQLKLSDFAPNSPLLVLLERDRAQWILDWYIETERAELRGETSPSAIALLYGLIAGNGLTRIVQLGHYAGFSSIMIGLLLQRMGVGKLVSFDIDHNVTAFAQRWIDKLGLGSFVELYAMDSADPIAPQFALQILKGRPELLFIDSSHQYFHTVKELDLWSKAMPPGAFIALHDASAAVSRQDHAGEGGVSAAFRQFADRNPFQAMVLEQVRGMPSTFLDPAGLGIFQFKGDHTPEDRGASASTVLNADPDFREPSHWINGESWSVGDRGAIKSPGIEGSISTYAATVPGELYVAHVDVAEIAQGVVRVRCGDGEPAVIDQPGKQQVVLKAGEANSRFGLYASAGCTCVVRTARLAAPVSYSSRRLIADPGFREPRQWIGVCDGWSVSDRGAVKSPGIEGGIGTYVPIIPGESYVASIDVAEIADGTLLVLCGGDRDKAVVIDQPGKQQVVLRAGDASSLFALYASSGCACVVRSVDMVVNLTP